MFYIVLAHLKSERLEGVSVPVTERSEGERVNVIHERYLFPEVGTFFVLALSFCITIHLELGIVV